MTRPVTPSEPAATRCLEKPLSRDSREAIRCGPVAFMFKRFALLTAGVSLVLASPACGSDDPELRHFESVDECQGTEDEPCLCPSGALSTRVCKDGRFGPCDCVLAVCGNGVVEVGEQCDKDDLNGDNCASATLSARPSGTLACGTHCEFETSGCVSGPLGGGGTMGGGGTFGSGGTLGGGAALGM
jgi:hypothetical protein